MSGPAILAVSLGVLDAPYARRALVAVVVIGVVAGCVGVHVVLRRMAFVTDAMSHTVFPGVVIAFALDRSVYLGALVAGAATALALAGLGRVRRVGHDALLALLLTGFFALGVAVVSRQRSYAADLTAFLFGRILTIGTADLVLMTVVAAIAILVLAVLHKELVLRAFDEDGAAALGYPLRRLDLVLALAVAAVMVTSLRAVGSLLTVALVLTPAATARRFPLGVVATMAAAVALAVGAGVVGLEISQQAALGAGVRLAPGATIVAVATAVFALVVLGGAVTARLRRHRAGPPTDAPAHGDVVALGEVVAP